MRSTGSNTTNDRVPDEVFRNQENPSYRETGSYQETQSYDEFGRDTVHTPTEKERKKRKSSRSQAHLMSAAVVVAAVAVLAIVPSSIFSPIPHCQLAVLAGNMPSGIAGPYEGPRRMWSDDVLDPMFADCFGFTVPETRAMMEHFGHPELSDEVLSVYGGYRFGGMEMCDPGGIARYIYADFSYDSLRRDFSRNIPLRYGA